MRGKHSNHGTTMVEVIVAFAVLILIMGIFSQALTLTGRMMNRADDTLKGYRSLAGDYYMDQITPNTQDGKLQFKDEKNGGEFEVPVTMRAFSDSAGNLYDVAVETSGGEKPPESPDSPDSPEPNVGRLFTTTGTQSKREMSVALEPWQENSLEGIEEKFALFFNSENAWKNIKADNGKELWYRTYVSNGTTYALGGWEGGYEDNALLKTLIVEKEAALDNNSGRVTNVRENWDTVKQGHIMECVSGGKISGVKDLKLHFKLGTGYIERISFVYGWQNSVITISYWEE